MSILIAWRHAFSDVEYFEYHTPVFGPLCGPVLREGAPPQSQESIAVFLSQSDLIPLPVIGSGHSHVATCSMSSGKASGKMSLVLKREVQRVSQ